VTRKIEKMPAEPITPDPDSGSGDPVESLISAVVGSWKELLIGLALAAAIIVSVSYYRHKTREARERAFTQLALASTASQLNEILGQFPGTKAAELAAFKIARAQYDAGQYAEADDSYAAFLKNHPKHFMAPAAQLGRIHCREAIGQFEDALAEYRRFAALNPAQTALVITARLGEARCLRQTDNPADALALYENLILETLDLDWQPLIEELKSSTERDLERLSRPAFPTPAPAS